MTPKERAAEYAKNYYRNMVGMTVVGIHTEDPEWGLDPWVTLICERDNAAGELERFHITISSDPEGNEPGFLFGIPEPSTD